MKTVRIMNIANRLIELSDFSVTNLRLQKLLYYAYGMIIYSSEGIDIDEEPEAWAYGPVFPTVYHTYKVYGTRPIRLIFGNSEIGDEASKETVEMIYNVLGAVSEFTLVAMTHGDDGPWRNAYEPNVRHKIIPKESIKKYFESIKIN